MSGQYQNNAMDTMNFLQIYDQHMSYVYRYISYRVGNPGVTADLTSAVFEKALAAFENYRKEMAAPRTWLITIARNTVTDYLRRMATRNTVPIEEAMEVAANDPTPQEELEMKEEKELLRLCISLLSLQEREIISLKFGSELTNRDIAVTAGMSYNNIGVILYRAIIKLRDCFSRRH
jgi:RNA polymerase sigma factor (sigma-70 family)